MEKIIVFLSFKIAIVMAHISEIYLFQFASELTLSAHNVYPI